MKLSKELADLRISGKPFLGSQRRFQPTQDRAIELVHQREVQIEQSLEVIRKQNARHRHADPVLDEANDGDLLLHLPVQFVGIDLQHERGVCGSAKSIA